MTFRFNINHNQIVSNTTESTVHKPISLREWLSLSGLSDDEQETNGNEYKESEHQYCKCIFIFCLFLLILYGLYSYIIHQNISTHFKFVKVDVNRSRLIKTINNIPIQFNSPAWNNVLKLNINTRSVVFDERVSSIYVLSEMPYALFPAIMTPCHNIGKCKRFPIFLAVLNKSEGMTVEIQIRYYTNDTLHNVKCFIVSMTDNKLGFYQKYAVWSRILDGANFDKPLSYTPVFIECPTNNTNSNYLSEINSNILLNVNFQVNTTTLTQWVDLYFDKNKTNMFNNTSIKNNLVDKHNNTMGITTQILQTTFIYNQVSDNNKYRSICFLLGVQRDPRQIYWLHPFIEHVFNNIGTHLSLIVHIIMYVDIKEYSKFNPEISNISSFVKHYNINPKYINNTLFFIKWEKQHEHIETDSQQLAYVDAIYRFRSKYKWLFYFDPDEFLIINDYSAFETVLMINNTEYYGLDFNRFQSNWGAYFYLPGNESLDILHYVQPGKQAMYPEFVIIPWIHSPDKRISDETKPLTFCKGSRNVEESFKVCPFYLLHFKWGRISKEKLAVFTAYHLNHSLSEKQLQPLYQRYDSNSTNFMNILSL